MSKWNAARADAAAEEELEAEEARPKSLGEVEAARKARLAEWKAKQGGGDGNTNFIPVASDWRRALAERKAGRR